MATSSPWEDPDHKLWHCAICLERLKEPKSMPCLHRFCKDCLIPIIQRCRPNNVFKCPECREHIPVPRKGVDGFKTDFNWKNLLECVKMQQILKCDEIRECYSCTEHRRVAAFCFRCSDFLCKDCYNVHVKNKTLKDHKKHTLSVEDIKAKNITIATLVSMKDAPMCHNHPEKMSELLCETCDNRTVCMACTFGEHKGHDLHKVKALAKMRRKELAQQIENLKKVKKNRMSINAKQALAKLKLNARNEKEKLISMHEEKTRKLVQKIKDIEGGRERVKQKKQNAKKQIFDSLQRKMENEIKEVKKKYEQIFEVKKIEISGGFQYQESALETELARVKKNLEYFDREKNALMESIEKQLQQNGKLIETITEYFDNINKRFETLNELTSDILAYENDWSAVHNIPDMCTAASNLMEYLKKEFPELTTLTEVTVNYQKSYLGKPSHVKISQEMLTSLTFNNKDYLIDSVVSGGNGNIVISGHKSDRKQSFIVVIDVQGEVLNQKIINHERYVYRRFCDILSQRKVATVGVPNEIGVYDILDGSYIKKNISDVISSRPKGRDVTCVAADPVNHHILVGGYHSRDIYVFDDQLKYLHILTLPDMVKWPRDITVSDGHLLVCDYTGKKSYVTTMEGSETSIVGEIMRPNLGGNDLSPEKLCRDKNGWIYMLWKEHAPRQCYLVQYSQDGSQLLTERKLERDADVVTTLGTSVGEKLVLASFETRQIELYNLIKEE